MIRKLKSDDDRANSFASSGDAPILQLFTTALVDDLWISILMFLNTEELLGIVNLIDRKLFGRLLQSEYLWYRLLMRDFPRWVELNRQLHQRLDTSLSETQPATSDTIDSCLDGNDSGNNNKLGLNVSNDSNDDDEENQSYSTLLRQYRQLYHESMFSYDLEQSDVPVSRPYFVSNIWLVGQCIEYGPWFTDALKQRIVQRLTPPVAPLNPVIPPYLTFYLHHHHHHHHDHDLASHQLNSTSGTNAGWSQKMQLWQSCGPSRFQSCITPDMIVAVFDMDDEMNRLISDDNLLNMVMTSSTFTTPSASPPSSLSIAQLYLYRLLRTWARRPPPAMLVGISMSANRDDLRSEHVSTEDIRAWCSKQKISYMHIRSSEPDSQLYDLLWQMAVNNVSGVRHRKTMRSISSQRKRPRPNTIGIQPPGASDGTTSCIIG